VTKKSEDWEKRYGNWFHQQFIQRLGFEPSNESIVYALKKYAVVAEQ